MDKNRSTQLEFYVSTSAEMILSQEQSKNLSQASSVPRGLFGSRNKRFTAR